MAQYEYTGYESAFVPNPMGDPTGGYAAYETEEERRRREEEERRRAEEAASQVVQSQQIQTRADGSQVVTTKTERPAQQAQRPLAFKGAVPVVPGAPAQPAMPPQYGAPQVPGAPRVPGAPSMQFRPVAPEATQQATNMLDTGDLFRRIIGAESGGRHTDRQGNILTSPAGAIGIAQIKPTTAASPGFGIQPATVDEIRTPEGNLAFGNRYLQGMIEHFNGDKVKATAAYNAGPGRVQQAEQMAAERGGSFLDYLPRETINYVGKIFGSIIPSAQAGTLPQREAGAGRGTYGMPQAQPGPGVAVATGRGVQGTTTVPVAPTELPREEVRREPVAEVDLTKPQTKPVEAVEPGQATAPTPESITPAVSKSQPFIDLYQNSQDNPQALIKLSADENAPEFIRSRASNRAADLLVQQRELARAQEELGKMTPQQAGRVLTERPREEGSWAKYILFGALGMTALRDMEASKLGIGTSKIVQDEKGNAYEIKMGPDGKLIEGFDGSGNKLTPEQLLKIGAGTTERKLNIVGGSYVNDKTGEVGRLITDEKTGQSYIQTDKGRRPMEGFRPQGQAGTLDMQRVQQIQRQNVELAGDWAKLQMRVQGAAPEAANKFIGEFNAKHGTNFGVQSIGGAAPQIDLTTGQMSQAAPQAAAPVQAAPQAAPVQAAPQAAPAVQPAAPVQPTAPVQAAPQAARPAVPVAPTAPAAAPAAAARPVPATPADIESQRRQEEERRKAALEVGTAEQKDFGSKTVPEIGQTASDGQAISNARKQQLDIIRRNPSIINIMNGTGSTYEQARRIIIKAASGAYGNEERAQLDQDLQTVMNKLSAGERGALQEFVNLNTLINAKTLRANAGPGAVSNAEQQANKEANIGNLDRIEVYGALAGLHRSQFTGDLAASKQAFLAANPQLKTTREFNTAWQQMEATRLKEYQAIAKARFDIMGKPPAVNAGPEAHAAYKDRVFRAFELYPAPEFDPTTGKWNYKTANARRAAMAAVLGQ